MIRCAWEKRRGETWRNGTGLTPPLEGDRRQKKPVVDKAGDLEAEKEKKTGRGKEKASLSLLYGETIL